MLISRLHLTDFRNYLEADLSFMPGPNVLVGANGQGKTNILEAIGYVSTLSSHRVASDVPLVRRGTERAIVQALAEHDGRSLQIDIEINSARANRVRLNRAPVSRSRDIIGLVRTVLFAPEDLALVKGDPSDRRRFLDDLLIMRFPRYSAIKTDYERVLRQRNALLKTAGLARRSTESLDTLHAWDEQLIRFGAELLAGRLQLVDDLRPHYQKAYEVISDSSDEVGMSYRASAEDDDGQPLEPADIEQVQTSLRERLEAVRSKEIDRGLSLVGPHRDELLLTLDDGPARGYASHGQSWSIALALRLASYELLASDGAEPILMLDDVFAELDEKRRAQLVGLANRAQQTFVTAAVAGDIPHTLEGQTFAVHAGTAQVSGDND